MVRATNKTTRIVYEISDKLYDSWAEDPNILKRYDFFHLPEPASAPIPANVKQAASGGNKTGRPQSPGATKDDQRVFNQPGSPEDNRAD